MDFNPNIIPEKIKNIGVPLYCSVFGSRLYGTNDENSDIDYKGIYLPHISLAVTGAMTDAITYSTGKETEKNTKDDIDIQFWSLQYWLKLLAKGDTNAVDLLASMYSNHQEKYFDTKCEFLFGYDPMELIDLKKNRAYIGFALSQMYKYKTKGEIYGLLIKIKDFASSEKYKNYEKSEKLLNEIIEKFYDENMCLKKDDGIIYIAGKGFMPGISVHETRYRLANMCERYGDRVKNANKNENADWKSVSHALRCLDQVLEMFATKKIVRFPLKNRQFLKDVRHCKYPIQEIEEKIEKRLSELSLAIERAESTPNIKEKHFDIILRNYSLR